MSGFCPCPAALAASTAARLAAEGGAARLDLRGRGLEVRRTTGSGTVSHQSHVIIFVQSLQTNMLLCAIPFFFFSFFTFPVCFACPPIPSLEAVPADVWDMAAPGISFIDLGDNELTGESAVPPMALEMCDKLEVLILDGNKLTHWPLPTSGGISSTLPLRELNLAHNLTLRAAPPGAFARTPLLQKLDLSNVSIPFAPSGFLEPLVKLRELRWAKGALTQIPDGVYCMVGMRFFLFRFFSATG